AVVMRLRGLERQHVGSKSGGLLLGEGVILVREQPRVQGVSNRGDPAMMKVVKNARFNPCPIMNRHGLCLPTRADERPACLQLYQSQPILLHAKSGRPHAALDRLRTTAISVRSASKDGLAGAGDSLQRSYSMNAESAAMKSAILSAGSVPSGSGKSGTSNCASCESRWDLAALIGRSFTLANTASMGMALAVRLRK